MVWEELRDGRGEKRGVTGKVRGGGAVFVHMVLVEQGCKGIHPSTLAQK